MHVECEHKLKCTIPAVNQVMMRNHPPYVSVTEPCDGWLSTRNKRKIKPPSPKHKRRRLCTMRVFPRLSRTDPPHPLLFSATKQTTMHGFFSASPTPTVSKRGNADSEPGHELDLDVVIVDPSSGRADHVAFDSEDHVALDRKNDIDHIETQFNPILASTHFETESQKQDSITLPQQISKRNACIYYMRGLSERGEITQSSMSDRGQASSVAEAHNVECKQTSTTGRLSTRCGTIEADSEKTKYGKDEPDESRLYLISGGCSDDSSRRKCLDKGQSRNSNIKHIFTRSSKPDNSTVKHIFKQNSEQDKFQATRKMSSSELYDDYEYDGVRQNVLKELNIDNTLTFTDTFSDYENIHKTRLCMFNMDDSLSSDSQSWKPYNKDTVDEKTTSIENKDCDVDGPFHDHTGKEKMRKFIGPPAETCKKKFARDCCKGKQHYKKERPLVYIPFGLKVYDCDSLQFSQSESIPPGANSLLDKVSVESPTQDPAIVKRCSSQQAVADSKSSSPEVPSKRLTATGQVTRQRPSWTPRLGQDRSQRHLESSSGDLIGENRVCSGDKTELSVHSSESLIAFGYDSNYDVSLSGSEFHFQIGALPELENTLTFTSPESDVRIGGDT